MASSLLYRVIFSSKSPYASLPRIRIADLSRWVPLAWAPAFQSHCGVQGPLFACPPKSSPGYPQRDVLLVVGALRPGQAGGVDQAGWQTPGKLREVFLLKLVDLFLEKDTRLGDRINHVVELAALAGGGKGAVVTSRSAPVLPVVPPSPASPQVVGQLFPEQRVLQHARCSDLSKSVDHASERSTVWGKRMYCRTLIHGIHCSCKRVDMGNNSYCSTWKCCGCAQDR